MRFALPLAAMALVAGGLAFGAPAMAASSSGTTSIACPAVASLTDQMTLDDWSDYNAAVAACTTVAPATHVGVNASIGKKPVTRPVASSAAALSTSAS